MTFQETLEAVIKKMMEVHDESIDGPMHTYLARELANRDKVLVGLKNINQTDDELKQKQMDELQDMVNAREHLMQQCRHWNVQRVANPIDHTIYDICHDCNSQQPKIKSGIRLPTENA